MELETAREIKDLPAYAKLLKKAGEILLYTNRKFDRDVDVDLRSSNPIEFLLNCQTPKMLLWLRITNMSPWVKVVFDQALINMYLKTSNNHILLLDREVLREKIIISQRTTEYLYRPISLNDQQLKNLESFKGLNDITASITIEANIQSRFHSITRHVSLENILCRIRR